MQRTSGGTFIAAELNTFVEAFTYLCWLCAEARCGPLLPVGFDGQGSAVWSQWNPTRTESFTPAATWLDKVHAGEAEALFPTFMARFGDLYWREVVIHAVEYLVEAGRPRTLQRAIVMAQILLETLSYSWLVEERALRTHTSFERHTAAENIRAMLVDMGIPVAMPTKLVALAATRTRNGQPADGPQALVLIRNGVIHRRRRGVTGPPISLPSSTPGGSARGTPSWPFCACAGSPASTATGSATTCGPARWSRCRGGGAALPPAPAPPAPCREQPMLPRALGDHPSTATRAKDFMSWEARELSVFMLSRGCQSTAAAPPATGLPGSGARW